MACYYRTNKLSQKTNDLLQTIKKRSLQFFFPFQPGIREAVKKAILQPSPLLCIQQAILGDEYGNGPRSCGTISFQRGRSGLLLDSINSSSCHSSFLCPPLCDAHPQPTLLAVLFSNTFRPMILDEQSQKQNELEQPR